VKSIVIVILLIGIFSASLSSVHGIDTEFILECSTWYESYELTSKSEFIMVWGKGAIDCYDMLDSWTGKLFLWHNDDLITDEELQIAITYIFKA